MASIVSVYHGGRGSGKTESMSVAMAMAMARGIPVWANYPIRFNLVHSDGRTTCHESIPVEIEDLITFKQEIRGGRIALDELNLWASNRGSAGMVNRLLNSWMQLIRKRGLSLSITTQNFMSLDLMIRWQTDVTVECHDLHFMYHSLPEGAVISQKITDWSGIYTGRSIDRWYDQEAIARNRRLRTLHAKRFWGIYDSWTEFDIMKAMTKYQVNRKKKVISTDELGQAYASATASPGDRLEELARNMQTSYPGGIRLSRDEMEGYLREYGVNGGKSSLSKMLDQHGFIEDEDSFILPARD